MSVTFTSFTEAHERFQELLALLARQNLSVHPASAFAQMAAGVDAVMNAHASGLVPAGMDVYARMHDLVNAWYLAELCRALSLGPTGPGFVERLGLLTKGDPRLLQAGVRSNARDVFLELVVAAVCSKFCTDVRFEEPDVTATFAGKRWGLACKLPSGSPSSAAKLVRKGIKQIHESAVDYGIVVLHLADQLNHARLLPNVGPANDDSIGSFRYEHGAVAVLTRELTDAWRPIMEAVGNDRRRTPPTESGRARSILGVAVGSTVYQQRWSVVGRCVHHPLFASSANEQRFAAAFNDALQDFSGARSPLSLGSGR